MIKRKGLIKNYKWIMSILFILGVCLILISRLEIDGLNSAYTAGLGVGLIVAALLNLVIISYKRRHAAFEEEVEMQMQDERVKLNKMKAMAYAGVVAIAVLILSNMMAAYFDFDLAIGNIIVLFSYTLSLAGFKWFYRDK